MLALLLALFLSHALVYALLLWLVAALTARVLGQFSPRARAVAVASVLLAVLGAENTVRGTYELLGGDVPVDEAVKSL